MELNIENWLNIYQEQGRWQPWPLIECCTGPRGDRMPYTGNCNRHGLLWDSFRSVAIGRWQSVLQMCPPSSSRGIAKTFSWQTAYVTSPFSATNLYNTTAQGELEHLIYVACSNAQNVVLQCFPGFKGKLYYNKSKSEIVKEKKKKKRKTFLWLFLWFADYVWEALSVTGSRNFRFIQYLCSQWHMGLSL